MVGSRIRQRVHLQRLLGRLAVFVLAPLAVLMIKLAGYRVRNLSRIRRQVREIVRAHEGPWVICANHLTLIDSAILAYAMAPMHIYMVHYRRFPWNLPERRNFRKNAFAAACLHLAKCIPVVRRGDRSHIKETLDKCVCLLQGKDSLLVFPEGTRSRSGRVDLENYSYGVGRFLEVVQDCRVMCIYLRGDGQRTYSDFPRFGERFVMDIAVLHTATEHTGLRAQKEHARQIMHKLARMEDAYFAARGERCC